MLSRIGSSRRTLFIAVLLPGMLVALALFAGYLPRRSTTKLLDSAAATRMNTPPIVNAAVVTRAPTLAEVSFPGSITPITEAYIFARAAGYLKRRYVDIGDRVSAGQLLAEIDAPDLDQQVTQAQAALAQAEGQLGQAEATLQQLIATLEEKSNDLEQRLTRFASVLDESLEGATERAREIARLTADATTGGARAIAESFESIRSNAEEERARTPPRRSVALRSHSSPKSSSKEPMTTK